MSTTPVDSTDDVTFDTSSTSTVTSSQEPSIQAGEHVNPKSRNVFRRLLARFAFISVEPVLFLHMLAWSSTGVNVQAFYLQRICEREYDGDPYVDCTNITANETAEARVESIATTYSTFRNLIEAGLPVIFSLFIGPWSDKHGSKYPMILPLIGYTISSLILYIFSLPEYVDPNILLIASIPVAFSGGAIAFLLSAFKYVAGATSTKDRSFRMAIAEGSWFFGSPIGLLGSAALFKWHGYQLVFLTCVILYSAATLYALFLIPNDKPPEANLAPNSNICKDMFNLDAVKDTFRTTFGPRPGHQRLWILLLFGAMYLRVFTVFGSMTVTFLYARKMFQWDTAMYSAYVTYDGLIGIAGSSVVAVLGMKIFKISDAKIGLLSSISYLGGSVVWLMSGITRHSWMMYLGATSQMFCGLITIMSRSMVSKLVHKDEVGKIYSMLASGESALPLLSTPIYNYIYAKTVDSFPATCYAFTASLNLIILIVFIYFCAIAWNTTVIPHQVLEEETPESEPVNQSDA